MVLITKGILQLAETPRPNGCKKMKDTGLDLWRIRIGDYRVNYVIDDTIKIIDIQKLGHRKDIYE